MITRIITTFILATVTFYIMAWSNNFNAWEICLTGYLGCLLAVAVFEYTELEIEHEKKYMSIKICVRKE